jgi:hypothetical protein
VNAVSSSTIQVRSEVKGKVAYQLLSSPPATEVPYRAALTDEHSGSGDAKWER